MAFTVKDAFEEFMRDSVNLDPDVVARARKSRDNLLENIAEFSDREGFFRLHDEFNVHFGSFARKTKCRELDDIDLMIGIWGGGATYFSLRGWNQVDIYGNHNIPAQKECMNYDGTLNSIKVTNKFKERLNSVRDYFRSDIRRNGEAVVLNLISRDWSFDIVPCFYTAPDFDGRSYYLIPNGEGGWKKTDPRVDRNHMITTNTDKNGRVLELIRLCKKWNKVKKAKTIPSYLLETLIVNFADSQVMLNSSIEVRFKDALHYIADNIMNPVTDMKRIQGNINELSYQDRQILCQKAITDYNKAKDAIALERSYNYKESIRLWCEIFGEDFPLYG